MLNREKLKLMALLGFITLSLIGCVDDQPSFNPNNNGLVVVKGRTYIVPLEAYYTTDAFRSENEKGVVKLRHAGLDCRKGDISWISKEVQKAAQEAKLDGDINRAASIVIEAPRKGYMGCAHPISREEYDEFRSKKQK